MDVHTRVCVRVSLSQGKKKNGERARFNYLYLCAIERI